jgi:WD repeat and FYVE domain-containing protein 3
MHSGKLHYVSANPGGGAATLAGAASVYAVLGTPPHWRRYSRLLWRQGPALLLEDVRLLPLLHYESLTPEINNLSSTFN